MKMKKQQKQLNFIQNEKYCNWHLYRGRFSLAADAESTITWYHFCFIQKSLIQKIGTISLSSKAQI